MVSYDRGKSPLIGLNEVLSILLIKDYDIFIVGNLINVFIENDIWIIFE